MTEPGKGSKMPHLPAVPRDYSDPTESEINPFRSRKINILKSRALVPAILTAGFGIMLFATMTVPVRYAQIVGVYVILMTFWLIYAYSSIARPIYFYAIPAAIAWALLEVYGTYHQPFAILSNFVTGLLGGGATQAGKPMSSAAAFSRAFISAGLAEEILKAIPALAALWLLNDSRKRLAEGRPQLEGYWHNLQLRGPLDGVMLGAASAASFIAYESLFGHGNYWMSAFQGAFDKTKNQTLAWLQALENTIPRVLEGVAGHIGYAMLAGYFIGLAAIRPKAQWKLVGLGIVVATVPHGLWDFIAFTGGGWIEMSAIAMATTVAALAVLVKARQMEGARVTDAALSGSIIAMPAPSAPVAAPANRRQVPASAPTPQAGGLAIDLLGKSYLLEDLQGSADPRLSELTKREPGASFELVRAAGAPAQIGLKNTGSLEWTVLSSTGAKQAVAPGKTLKLKDGMRVAFGSVLARISEK